jgi:3-deoxy-manno-octulosonate cytidylyltransferase (CMP-KDO synthetase)
MKVLVIIPARYASERLPAKVLAPLLGKPLLQWTWEQAQRASRVDEVLIATDDERVLEAVKKFGGKGIMTAADHASGTDRVAEVAAKGSAQLIVNLQGDEPLMHPETIDRAIMPFLNDDNLAMGSAKVEIQDLDSYFNPNVVKVVCDDQDFACYFSRAPIPHYRGREKLLEKWRMTGVRPPAMQPAPFKHLGLYVYRTDFLQAFARLPRPAMEDAEKLEQLRALAWGFKIKVVTTPHDSIGVDTAEDLRQAEAILGARLGAAAPRKSSGRPRTKK